MTTPAEDTAAPAQRTPRALRAAVLVALAFGLASVLWAAWEQDLTADEPYHMQWSRRLLEQRVSERKSDPMWNSKTPISLANVLAKQAARAAGVPPGRAQTFAARLPGVGWYLGLLALTFLLARRLLGPIAARIALIGVALDPSLIAHSAVATVDSAYTFATLLALATALRYAARPSPARAAVVGLALGFAFVTKFTAFLLLPGLALLPLVYRWTGRKDWRRSWMGMAADACTIAVAALAVVCAAYLFVGVGLPLGEVAWKSGFMARVAQVLPGLRLPLPVDFLTGFDISFAHERERAWAVLILDRRFPDGVWWYFAVSWLLKTPLALLLAQVAGLALLLRARRLLDEPALAFLGANLALSLFYFSCLFRAQIGYRYALMCIPLAWLLAAAGWTGTRGPAFSSWAARAPAAALVVVLLAAAESRLYLGNTLAFTNSVVLPKRRAFRYVTDSSIDWGQNDEKVKPWMDAQGWTDSHFEPTHIRPGINVMGVTSFAGGARYKQHRWLREHADPNGHFRHTYLWFDVSEAQYQRFLDEDRRLPAEPDASEACTSGKARPLASLDALSSPPETPERAPVWVLCLTAEAQADLGLRIERGGPLFGRLSWALRDWDKLRQGEQLWYRLDPGEHVLAIAPLGPYVGRFEVRGGPLRAALRPARLKKKGVIELID